MESAQQTATTEALDCSAKPRPEHEWLQKLSGEWTCEGEAFMGPDQPPARWKGTEVARSLGGMWVVLEGSGEMPGGGSATTIMTLGFDPRKDRYVGTFVGSMMDHMWIYEGSVNGSVLTLDTEGPTMSEKGGLATYQDIVEIVDENTRTLRSVILGGDGQWQQIMTATYRRKQ